MASGRTSSRAARAPTAIVLGLTHGGLAAARSLSGHGVRIVGATFNPNEFGTVSRHLDELVICPDPSDVDAFVDFLLDRAPTWSGSLVLETNDYFLTAIATHREALGEHYRLVTPPLDVARSFLEKDRTYALADRCGVAHPAVHVPTTMEELAEIEPDLRLPIMIKPIRSHEFVRTFGEKLLIVDRIDELRRVFSRAVELDQPVVLSEIVPGTDYGTLERIHLYIDRTGEVAAAFSNLKLRQTPPMYGVMRVGRSTPANAEVEALALRLLHAAGFRGFASVEFKRDPRDGELKLIEVNIRVPRSAALPIRSGVDFPWLIFRDLVDDVQERVETYDPQTYLVEFPTDLVDFVRHDRQRLRGLGRFVGPYLRPNKTWAIPARGDMKPFVKVTMSRGRAALNRIRR